jgi:AraC-like DNA-binding protein
MQHIEFFHKDHFAYRYHRKKAKHSLAHFIDFFWETDFDVLYKKYPGGFSDALFPNIGYTYLINLGTPFVMQLEEEKQEVRSDAFLPRYKNMICHHSAGNKIFGIKFKVSPVIFEKKINFSEYRDYLFPLAYLIDPKVVCRIKEADSFAKRVEIISHYYSKIIERFEGAFPQVSVVTSIIKHCNDKTEYDIPIEELAAHYSISSRTLQRYFEACTSINCKQALQLMRIRKAIEDLSAEPASFDCSRYGYYDYSHFYKHLKSFINVPAFKMINPHLKLLKTKA